MSEVSAVIKLIDLALTATTAIEEQNQAIARINERLKRAHENGEEVTWAEVEEKQKELGDLINKHRSQL